MPQNHHHKDACFAEPNIDLENYKTLWEAILAEPNQPWDYWKLSEYPDLPWNIVTALSNKPWHWHKLSSHPQLDFDFVRSVSDKDWDWGALSEHPNISLETIATNPDYFWKFRHREVPFEILIQLPRYKNNLTQTWFVPWSIVLHNPTLDWEWDRLSQRKDLTWDIVLKHPELPWDWDYLTKRRNVTMEVVQSLPDKPWQWNDLTCLVPKNKLFHWLKVFTDKPWDYRWISLNFTNTEMDWEVFWSLNHPASKGEAWNYTALYKRTENMELLLRLKQIQWKFTKPCPQMNNLSWETIRRCMEENRESTLTLPWKQFHRRRDLPWEYVVSFTDWPWCWWSLSAHTYLTFRFYNAHRAYPWNHKCIHSRFRNTAAHRIQCQWRRSITDPSYRVCQRRLMREFEEMHLL